MKVALVHSYYSSAQVSGENVAVDRQRDALVAAGHEVQVVARRTDELESARTYRATVSFTTAAGRGPSPERELQSFHPDIVHVHNLFPNFGTKWLERWSGPLVATLHNFRTICANGLLMRDGADCTLCPSTSSLWAVRHRCYRNSALATIPLAIASRRTPVAHPLIQRAERMIVLSELVAETYRSHGVPESKLVVLPNFVPPLGMDLDSRKTRGWLLAGRLSPEKGVVDLLRAWPQHLPLDVAGAGPDEALARSVASSSVRFLGSIDSQELRQRMREHTGLIFPSKWREHSPLVFLEALEAGLPIVALRGSGPARDVEAHGLGVVVDELSETELSRATATVQSNRAEIAARCRRLYEQQFSEARWVASLMDIYQAARAG